MIHTPSFLTPRGFGRRVFGELHSAKVLATDYANLIAYWQMTETTGSTFVDSSGFHNDIPLSGVTLNAAAGVDGLPMPYFDGASDYANLLPGGTTLASDFSGLTGTLMGVAKIAAAEWVDGSAREMIRFRGGSGVNLAYIRKAGYNNAIEFQFDANGVSKLTLVSVSLADVLFTWCMTWDDANDRTRLFINGAEATGSPVTGIGTWNGGVLSGNNNVIGAAVIPNTEPFLGYQGHFAWWKSVLTDPQIAYVGTL